MRHILFAAAVALCAAAPASAQDAPAEHPQALREVIGCRAVADSAERLACYDREVAEFETAATSRELVVMDREQVRETRRGLFGFSLPSIKLFGGGSDEEEDISELETTIASAGRTRDGKWLMTIEDGAVWQQTDGTDLFGEPARGSSIVIRRGALGSYMARIDGQRAIRVMRVR